MSKKIMYVSKFSIVSPTKVSTDLKKKIRKAMSSIDFSNIKFEHIIDKENNAMDIYRVLGSSNVLSKDGRYLSGFLLKESSVITGKIEESIQIKHPKRSENDEGIRFTIDLSEGIIVHNTKGHFKIAQFNKALTYILNIGINNFGITNVNLEVKNIKDNIDIFNLKKNLKNLGKVEKLEIQIKLFEKSKDYSFIENPEITSHTKIYETKYATGLNFNSHLEKELNNIISLHSEIEKVRTSEKVDIGNIEISGKTVIGRSFGTAKNITYEIDEKYTERVYFIDKSKDIIEDYIKTFY